MRIARKYAILLSRLRNLEVNGMWICGGLQETLREITMKRVVLIYLPQTNPPDKAAFPHRGAARERYGDPSISCQLSTVSTRSVIRVSRLSSVIASMADCTAALGGRRKRFLP